MKVRAEAARQGRRGGRGGRITARERAGLLGEIVNKRDHIELQVERILHGRCVVVVLVEPLRVVRERALGEALVRVRVRVRVRVG